VSDMTTGGGRARVRRQFRLTEHIGQTPEVVVAVTASILARGVDRPRTPSNARSAGRPAVSVALAGLLCANPTVVLNL
jgi:hypothetical protein